MIKDAVLHLLNEQPLVVDLFDPPSTHDSGLLCTNVRTTAGKRPAFADRIDSTFLFPYAQIRFLEIAPEGATSGSTEAAAAAEPEPADLDLDEDFLRRIRDA